MLMNTKDLTGHALNFCVTCALRKGDFKSLLSDFLESPANYNVIHNPALVDDIASDAVIDVYADRGSTGWLATSYRSIDFIAGPTRTMATLRCYAHTTFGDSVTIDDSILKLPPLSKE